MTAFLSKTLDLSDYGYVFRNGTIAVHHDMFTNPDLLDIFINKFCVPDFVRPIQYGLANSILVQLLPEVFESIKSNIAKEELEEKV